MGRAFQLIRERQAELFLLTILSLGLFVVIRFLFEWSIWQSLTLSVPVGVAIVAAFTSLIARRNRKQNEPLAMEAHPDLGEVRVFSDRWEAVISGPPFPQPVAVTGYSSTPSPQDLGLLRYIREQYERLATDAAKALAADLAMLRPPIRPQDLALSTISLYDQNEFSFAFDVPTRMAEIPDGFYADFANFEVQEAGWIH